MTGDIILLHRPETWRKPEKPVDPAFTLEAGLRSYIAVEEALTPWAHSVLIDELVREQDPARREALIAELARPWQ